jgi:preprotein translocase subunit SecG
MYTALIIVQVLIAIGLVTLILLQHGKGADAGAAFGAGASGTVFGARGASNFLSTATAWLATGFFAVSLALAYLVQAGTSSTSITDQITDSPAVETEPAQPATPVIPD